MMKKRPVISAYYFPNWHVDPRNEKIHGKGWTEWRVVQYATPTARILHLACWNEWTEGGYLEPDTQYGYGKLEAVKKIFAQDAQ